MATQSAREGINRTAFQVSGQEGIPADRGIQQGEIQKESNSIHLVVGRFFGNDHIVDVALS